MQSVLLAHRRPEMQAMLLKELAALMGVRPQVLPGNEQALLSALVSGGDALPIVDVELITGTILRQVSGRPVIAVTAFQEDPRKERLRQMGVTVVYCTDDPTQVRSALAQVLQKRDGTGAADSPSRDTGRGRGRVIAVHSPKGGTGTSTVAAYLATAWARQGTPVALVDLAPYGATPNLFKVKPEAGGIDALSAALEAKPDFLESDDLLSAQLLVSLPIPHGRLDLLVGGSPRRIDRLKSTHVQKLLDRLRHFSFQRILVDTSSEPTPRNLAALAAADQILLLGGPTYLSWWSLKLLQETLALIRPSGEMLLAINGVGTDDGPKADELEQLAARLKARTAGILPFDPAVVRLSNQGVPWELSQRSAFFTSVQQLARSLDGE